MFAEILFPKETTLQVERVESVETKVVVELFAVTPTAVCPQCRQESTRRHSYYYRFPADLPLMGWPVCLQLRVRRFFCDNKACPKQTFAEQFPILLATRARRTCRLQTALAAVAFEVSAESGARILGWLGIETGPDPLLQLVRDTGERAIEAPRVLGIDDWAKKKGRSYGTILIDLEAHRVVDVLSERSAEAVEEWLREHPGVEVISRDRGTDYIKGATAGAPDAIQVADRWHLLNNLREAVKVVVTERPACLLAAAEKPEVVPTESVAPLTPVEVEKVEAAPAPAMAGVLACRDTGSEPQPEPRPMTKAVRRQQARHARKQERFDLVRAFHQQGLSNREISRQTKMSSRTIRRYLMADSCPFYPEGTRCGDSKLDGFRDYLEERWQAGCHNATQLWREIGQQGFNGSRGLVAQWAAQARRLLPKRQGKEKATASRPLPKRVVPWSASRTAWLLVKPEAELDEVEKQALARVKLADELVAQTHHFVHTFQQMVRQKQPEKLESWIADVTASGIDGLVSFANGLQQDFDAVKNALSLTWSNGQTEGQVNRLKFIKRQMFGRANFDLLRRRVLGYPTGRATPAFT